MEKNKLLIYAHYYYPDVASTGQLLKEQAESMVKEFDISVICTVPSYTGMIDVKYKKNKFYYEKLNGVNIIRVRVPEFNKEKKFSRVKNILVYFWRSVLATIKCGKVDYILSISQPPILGGILGVFGKFIKKAKYIYVVQDWNPEQIQSVGYSNNKMIISALMLLDKFSCQKADKVITVGRDLVETLKKRFENSKNCPSYALINNWIDEKNVYPLQKTSDEVKQFIQKCQLQDKFVIMYSGNLGLYYDLENLLRIIKEFFENAMTSDGKKVIFAFVGDGSVKSKLVRYSQEKNMDNVIFIPYQSKEELRYSLNAADCHWCVNSKGIKGVSVPSKLYGIMAVAKPVLGVLESGSEARMIIEEAKCGLLASPGDYDCIVQNIRNMIFMSEEERQNMGLLGRKYLETYLTKEISINKYIHEIKNC